ncbi:hypothetical protein THASP1DRAFT_32911, partial [Thamnocephalis sphaerospora]
EAEWSSVFEFFQLISFPLRDLLRSPQFSDDGGVQSGVAKFADAVIRIVALLPELSTVYFYVQYWTITGAVAISLAVAVAFHFHNKYARISWPIFWVRYMAPIAGVLYLPVLTTYVNSAACLSRHVSHSLLRTQRCPPADTNQMFYLLFSLGAYVIAYLFMTVFLTSYDRTPVKGEISFKSSGVAFFDNLDLLLVIDFLLLPEGYTRLRGILSILILITLVCYNIRMQPCYVRPINYWRTTSLCCILWTALLVPILNDRNLDIHMSRGAIGGLIVGGWGVILVFFIFVRYCYRSEPYDPVEEAELCRQAAQGMDTFDANGTHPATAVPSRLVSAVNSFQSLVSSASGYNKHAGNKTPSGVANRNSRVQGHVLLESGSALERAMSRARPPPWKDPWAPLPPYYRQYQASSARRNAAARRRAYLEVPGAANAMSDIGLSRAMSDGARSNNRNHTPLGPNMVDVGQARIYQYASTDIGITSPERLPVQSEERAPAISAQSSLLYSGYQPRLSLPDIPTYILQEQDPHDASGQLIPPAATQPADLLQPGVAAVPLPPRPALPPTQPLLSTGTVGTSQLWLQRPQHDLPSGSDTLPTSPMSTLSTSTTAVGSDAATAVTSTSPAVCNRQADRISYLSSPKTIRSTLGRSRTRSMPSPPTWLGDLRELSRVSERTEISDFSSNREDADDTVGGTTLLLQAISDTAIDIRFGQ